MTTLLLIALFTTLNASALAADGLTIDQILGFRSASEPEISPDGSRVAYVAAGDIREVEIETGKTRLLAKGASPQWAPDGKGIAFLKDRQVWLAAPQPTQLTQESLPIIRFEWAPDASRIAYLVALPIARKGNQPTVEGQNNLPRHQIRVVHIASRQVTQVTSPDYSALGESQWFPDGFSWSPDSRRIAFTHRPHAKPGGHHQGDLAVIHADGSGLEIVLKRPGYDGLARWAPDGRELAFISTGRYDWVRISNLYRLSLTDRSVSNLSASFDESVKDFHWSSDGKNLFFIAPQGAVSQLFRASTTGGPVQQISNGQNILTQLSLSRDGRRCSFLLQNATQPPEVYVSPLNEWKPQRLSDVATQYTQEWAKLQSEIIRWKSFDGLEIEGILHKPAGYRKGTRYPLLVIPHGGPHGVSANVYPTGDARLFAERGWIVFLPNFRGSGGYGERFLRANLYGWGLGDYQDLMSGVDMLIERQLADPARLAISGASYGGYMTAWTISQTSRFKAAVAGCGIVDLGSFMRTTDVPDRFADYLGEDDRLYARHSPSTYGGNVKTPTLIWHGDQDLRVPLMQSRHLYTQLLKNQVPVELVIYHGEAHGARRADSRRDLLERQWNWITRWIH